MAPKLKCRGVATLIDSDPNAKLKFDKNNRFYVITKKMADKYIKQKNVPVILEHRTDLPLGVVDKFCIEKISVDDKKCDALIAEYTINNAHFIKALKDVTKARYEKTMVLKFKSSDNFIEGVPTSGDYDLDATAFFSLANKLPSISLSHDKKSLDISEMSLCVAAVRRACVSTDVVYENSGDGSKDDGGVSNENTSEEKFIKALATLHSLGNSFRIDKVRDDLEALNMTPCDALQYSTHVQDKNYINETIAGNKVNLKMSSKCPNCSTEISQKTSSEMYQVPQQMPNSQQIANPVPMYLPPDNISSKLSEIVDGLKQMNQQMTSEPSTANKSKKRHHKRSRVVYDESSNNDSSDEYEYERKRRKHRQKDERNREQRVPADNPRVQENNWTEAGNVIAQSIRQEFEKLKTNSFDPMMKNMQSLYDERQQTRANIAQPPPVQATPPVPAKQGNENSDRLDPKTIDAMLKLYTAINETNKPKHPTPATVMPVPDQQPEQAGSVAEGEVKDEADPNLDQSYSLSALNAGKIQPTKEVAKTIFHDRLKVAVEAP